MTAQQWSTDPNPMGELFREAYARFLERLQQADVAGPPADADPASGIRAAVAMSASLRDFSAKLSRNAVALLADNDERQTNQLQYAYAAMVDEVLLNRDWQGRALWLGYLAEHAQFRTRHAGQELFRRMAQTVKTDTQQSREIGEVYLQCLNLGFQGGFRGREDGLDKLLQTRKKMFMFVYRRRPDLQQRGRLQIETADVAPLVTAAEQRSLSKPLRWWRYLGGATLLLLGLSGLTWWHVVSVINPLLDDILQVSS